VRAPAAVRAEATPGPATMRAPDAAMGHAAAVTTVAGPEAAPSLREGDRRVWRRHPGDVARLVFRLGLLAVILALTAATPTALRETSADLVRLFARTPETLRDAMVGVAQVATALIPLVVLGWLLVRRTLAETALVVGAAAAGGVTMALLVDWLDRAAPAQVITDLPADWYVGVDFPSPSWIAALVAGTVAASPLMTPSWRRTAWIAVGVAVLVRLLTATQAPVNLAVTLALGAVVGSAALVAVGSPQRRPGAASLRAELAAGGLVVDDLRDEGAATGRRTYLGTADGRPVRVAYVDRDDRDADLLARTVRALRVAGVDEDALSIQPRRRVEHEALMTMLAGRAGASVPEVHAVVPTERDSALLALGVPAGRPLAELAADDVADAALDDAWHQLGVLHDTRIAHRSLTGDHVVVDGDRVHLVGLATARPAATDEQRAVDVAELLVTTALAVGRERALDAALRTTAASRLEAALPFVQPAALPAVTARAAKADKGLVADLRTGMAERLGVDDVELAPLERISLVRIVSWVGFAVLAFFVISLVTSWSDIRDAMEGIDWWWTVPVLIATGLGTVGGAMSLTGSVVRPIPLTEATVIMFGQSFLNRFTPANAGGMAMRIRYLQKGGTDPAVATAAIGLTSAASGLMQGLFIAFFFIWSGSDPTDGVTSGDGGGPDLSIVVVFVVAALVAIVIVAATPRLRRWVVGFVRSTLEKIRHDFGELARMPSKLALLFGGAGFAKLTTIVAFVGSCRAFDIDLSFATLGALYLAANTVASAVPTPGGVGAIEAALAFVLLNAGVDEATAWAAVLLFRLINYWLPTIPGYLALKISERRELV
jgi:glycosyltransferase 2 family protein